jgi:hypothetical protein
VKSRADCSALPPKIVNVEELEFNDEERAICELLCAVARGLTFLDQAGMCPTGIDLMY